MNGFTSFNTFQTVSINHLFTEKSYKSICAGRKLGNLTPSTSHFPEREIRKIISTAESEGNDYLLCQGQSIEFKCESPISKIHLIGFASFSSVVDTLEVTDQENKLSFQVGFTYYIQNEAEYGEIEVAQSTLFSAEGKDTGFTFHLRAGQIRFFREIQAGSVTLPNLPLIGLFAIIIETNEGHKDKEHQTKDKR